MKAASTRREVGAKSPSSPRSSTAGPFWPAEDYHQNYLEKNPGGYTCHYVRN